MQLGLTDEEKAARRGFIGGSDAGAIVAGGEEWIKLFWQKDPPGRPRLKRPPEDDLSNILSVAMGSFTEPLNCFWCEKQTGRMVTHRKVLARHPKLPYLAANLDGMTTTETGEAAYIDFKHVGKAGDQMTLRYTAQATHCAIIMGVDHWCLSTFIGNSKWELTEQEVDPFFAVEYLEKCAAFWAFVEADIEPPAVEPLPVPPPRKLRTVVLADDIDWPNWGPDMAEALGIYVRTKPAHDAHMASRDKVKTLMPEDVGTVLWEKIRVTKDRRDAIRISALKESDNGHG